jgi:hypothetical protein
MDAKRARYGFLLELDFVLLVFRRDAVPAFAACFFRVARPCFVLRSGRAFPVLFSLFVNSGFANPEFAESVLAARELTDSSLDGECDSPVAGSVVNR